MPATISCTTPAPARATRRPVQRGEVLVVKFGGTSLGSPARVHRAVRRVRSLVRRGYAPVVVVSATGGTTDVLLRRVRQVAPGAAPGRELDRVLCTGELLSAALVAAALAACGVEAVSLGAACAGIEAEGEFGRARPVRLANDRIRRVLASGAVPVVAGFQGVRASGEWVTLGRGGSDTTAVFLAAELGAGCHLVTDVDGVYDRDPRTSPEATRLDRLTHEALLRIAESGAEIVHPDAARIAALRRVPLRVYHFGAPAHAVSGTVVQGGEA